MPGIIPTARPVQALLPPYPGNAYSALNLLAASSPTGGGGGGGEISTCRQQSIFEFALFSVFQAGLWAIFPAFSVNSSGVQTFNIYL